MSQEHFGQLRSEAAAPPKPRRMYRLPDDDADDDYYADAAAAAPDSHPRQHALHVSKVRLNRILYIAEKKSLKILLSSTRAGPGRKVKQEQEEISRNHVPRLFLGSVLTANSIKINLLVVADPKSQTPGRGRGQRSP